MKMKSKTQAFTAADAKNAEFTQRVESESFGFTSAFILPPSYFPLRPLRVLCVSAVNLISNRTYLNFTLALLCLAPLQLHAQTTRPRRITPPETTTQIAQESPPVVQPAVKSSASRTITVRTAPRAFVWLNDIRRGTTDAAGTLTISPVPAGRHTLRARARGFREASVILLPAKRGTLDVKLLPTTDPAELAFGEAEELRETATDNPTRERALALYDRVLELRPRHIAAHTNRARTLFDLGEHADTLAATRAARRLRPITPTALAELSAIEGRTLRAQGDTEGSIAAYERAIREARGRQPEALTGLGIIYEDAGKYAEAAAAFRRALTHLQDSEPVVYQLLGSAYEQTEQYKEAVAAYEKYLELAPDGKLAPAIRSVIEQLRRQAAGENTLPY
jgi:tetratricopeptide (TPR) repeat protein